MQPLYYACDEGATSRLHSLLRRIMWRNSKVDVEAELGLPPRTDVVRHLKFAEVEGYLYSKRRDECEFKISSIIEKCGGDMSRISQSDMKKLIYSLLRLRQVCCHPQLGSRTGFQSLQKCTMSMTQLLDQLVVRARVECEESQRLVIMNSHGLAAVHIIDKEFLKAASIYRDVLGPKEIEVDILQRIHALHNLAEVEETCAEIDGKKDSVLFQAELSRIKEQESELRRQFMTRQFSRIAEYGHQLGIILRDIDHDDMLPTLESSDIAWWHETLDRLARAKNSDFLPRARDTLAQEAAGAGLKSIAERFRDLRGMDFTIMTEMDRLLKARNEALRALAKIVSKPEDDERLLVPLLAETMGCSKCHRRKAKEGEDDTEQARRGRQAAICTYCKVEDLILEYEKGLYVFKTQRVNQMNFEEEGLNKIDSELERLLRMLGSYVSSTPLAAAMFGFGKEKPSQIRDRLSEQCENHLRLFALFKKEIKTARTQWRAQYDYLMAVDELQMCDFRVRLRFEGEEVPEEEEHAKIHPYEVPILKNRFQADKTSYEMQYRQHVSQLRYLERLSEKERSAQTLSEGSICPICQEGMKDEVVMFQCGHEVCPACMMKILERVKSHSKTIKCPNCRARMNAEEATYIKRSAPTVASSSSAVEQEQEPSAVPEVKGSWGTKIESVVLALSKIFKEDPDAKVLIFSQWSDILMLIGRALQQNSISFLQMQGDKKKIKRILDKFKHDPTIRTLGLSFGKGADGLNLTEASHIVLVEPTMNPSSEQQAIGRIHRIGQTKPTTVTRLIVERTIEVNVFNLGQKRAASQEGDLGSTSGYGARQREAEIFSLDELNALLDSGNQSSFVPSTEDDLNSAEARQITLNAQYWNALVLVNSRLVPRNIALSSIQRQVYYALRETGVNLEQLESSFIDHKGKRLAPAVVSEIEKLRELDEPQDVEVMQE
jgi:E3 ubiquitin-protein ligase SHPRH